MADKHFFNSFFKNKNKIWNQIQNNPLARRDLWSQEYATRIGYRLLPLNMRDNANALDVRIPNGGPRLRLPAGSKNWDNNNIPLSAKITNIEQMKRRLHTPDYVNPVAGYPNPIDNATELVNVHGFKKYGLFRVRDWDLQKDDDYWFKSYEGDFTDINEKYSKRRPCPKYNKDSKFIKGNFMTPKQRESFIWLASSHGLINAGI